jgi:hypothetical protein
VSGYSGTPLAQKLGIRAGSRLYLHEAPAHYAQLVAPLPPGVQQLARLDARADIIHIFAVRRAALARAVRGALKVMRADAAIWVSWPKKSSRVPTDITEDVIREVTLPMTLVDIKVCAVDEVWSGLKLVIRKSARPPLRIAAPANARAKPRALRK